MPEISVSRDIAAPRSAVWQVLADFPNIADWNSGVKTSFATGEATGGVGATRHCDLAPAGALEETITEWEPEHRMVVRIDSAATLPIKTGHVTFTMEEGRGDTPMTPTTLHYDFTAKWGIVGWLMGPMLSSQLTKGFTGFLADLETAAAAVTPDSA